MPEQDALKRSEYVAHIDGLRALAVVSVIVYHLNHRWLPGGFSGVDVFFVISGFVVSIAQSHRQAKSLSDFASRFYARRIQRIVPALLVCLVTVSIACAVIIPGSWLAGTNGQTALYAFVGLSNIVMARTAGDYFAPRTEFNPFTHTWSLGVEEQFYVIFPLLFFLWAAARKRPSRRVSTLAFAALLLASIAEAWWLGRRDPTYAYYTILTRFWELAFGVVLYQATILKPGLFARMTPGVRRAGVGASLLLLGAGFAFASPAAFPYPWAFAPVFGTAGLLALLADGETGWARRFLSLGPVVFIGRMSYSLYLWHWPFIVLLRWTFGIESWPGYAAALAATFLFAFISFRLVESPFRYSKWLRRQPQLAVIAGGLAAIGLCWAFTYELFGHQSRFSLSVTRDPFVWGDEGPDVTKGQCPLRLVQTAMHGGTRTLMEPVCRAHGPRGRLFMVGDSHADRYVSLVKKFSRETGTTVIVYKKLGCSYLNLARPDRDSSKECLDFTRGVTVEMQREARPGDALFLPSLRLRRLGEQWANFSPQAGEAMTSGESVRLRAAAVAEAAGELQPLAARGVHVVFEAPKPVFRTPPFRCADWYTHSNPVCRPGFEMHRAYLLEYRLPVMQAFAALAKHVGDVRVWDPFPILCPEEPCRAMVNGLPLFFDGDHVSGFGNTRLYSGFRDYFTRVVSESPTPRPASAS